MDQNPVAPFDMHPDEVILWMEQQKKVKQSVKTKVILTIIGTLVALLAATLFYVPYFVNGRDLVVSIALPMIIVGFPLLLMFSISHNLQIGNNIYYVTNYRVITLITGKKSTVIYSYIDDIKKYEISNSENGEVSIEFKLKYEGTNSEECYYFYNINNAQEVGGIIDAIKSEYENSFETYDFVVQ